MTKQPAVRFEGPWAWTGEALALNRDAGEDEARVQLWTCSYFPSPRERLGYPLGVEFCCDGSDVNALNEVLLTLWARFEQDSLLAAVVRKPATSQVLLYTAALKPIAYDRIRIMRSELRLDQTLIRVFHDHRWDELKALLSSIASGAPR
jgi:hypothetical protein